MYEPIIGDDGGERWYWFPCIRHPKGFKRLLIIKYVVDSDYKGIKIKRISGKKAHMLDPWNDYQVTSWNERKSWKRKTKKRKQYD